MKKTLITLMLLAMAAVAWSQDNKERILELGKIAGEQFRNQQYDEALTNYQQSLALVQKDYGENDSLCVSLLAIISRCYHRQNAHKMALETGLKAAEIYGNHYSKDNVFYANLLDNNSLYYTLTKDYVNAEKCSDEALKIFYKYFTNDNDMAITLTHAAEIKHLLGKYKEAVALQEHALSLIENVEGTHTNHYISELKYLIKYYNSVENTEKTEELEALKDQLEEELKTGFVPPLVEFKTAEKCREHNEDAYYCSLYYLNHYLNADKMGQAAQYIQSWSMSSPDVMMIFGEPEAKWGNEKKNVVYMIAYMAACTKFALTHDPVDPLEQYKSAIIDMVNYYSANKELTGEVEAFEEYISLFKKDPKKLTDRLEKDYAAFQKAADKGKTTKLTTSTESEQ